MAYREVSVIEIREVLRGWLAGAGLRAVAAQAGVDRKTARRYVQAAQAAGVVREGGWGQVSDEVIGAVVAAVRPERPAGHGSAWQLLLGEQEQITAWVGRGLTVVKIGTLLERRGVVVPYRTLHRFCVRCCGFGRGAETVRVVDGDPGGELQVDFGQMGLVHDPVSGRRRVTHALIFTAVYSRHVFVWLADSQTLGAVIAGCEQAWGFFGGVFKVLVPENVPRNIFRLMFPTTLCGWRRRAPKDQWLTRRSRPHNDQSDESQSSSVWSELQIGRRRAPAEVPAGSVFRSASILAFVVISA